MIVALRRIEPGEEVTLDRSTDVGWEGFYTEFNCRAETCREVVKGHRFLPDGPKGRYGACVSSSLLWRSPPRIAAQMTRSETGSD